jgi:hypothetical protein
MTDDAGLPKVGRSARTLGVRLDKDISPDEHGNVRPQTGGLSVAPDDPRRLHPVRRPPTLGGRGRDPVWALDATRLPAMLEYRADVPERHGLIEPARRMLLADYETALAGTRPLWMQVFALEFELKRC